MRNRLASFGQWIPRMGSPTRLSMVALAIALLALFWVWAVKTTPCAGAQATCPIALTRVISQGLTVNEDGADSDSRLEGDTNVNLQYWDATTDAIGLGAVQVTGAFLGVTGYTTNRAGVTSVGREFHAPAGTFTQTNAASTTLAVGARYFIGVPTFAGSNASQVLTDAFTALYDAPAAGTNMTLTRAYTMGLSAGTTGTLWVSRDTDSATAAGGLLFGLSRDTNLYRSAADTLRTDDTFNANTALLEAGNAVPNATDNLGFFAATTSAQLAGVISDETGSGALLFATSPTMVGTWAGAVTLSGSTLTFSGGTVSTSTSTGTIVISGTGGLGMGGVLYVGSQAYILSTAPEFDLRKTNNALNEKNWRFDVGATTFIGRSVNDALNDSRPWVTVTRSGLTISTVNFTNGDVSVSSATASTSTTTGALVVTGGMGIGAAAYINGPFNITGTVTTGGTLINLAGDYTAAAGNHSRGMLQQTTVRGIANQDIYGMHLSPTFVEAGSGTHSIIAAAIFDPTWTGAAAITTTATTLWLYAAPSLGTANSQIVLVTQSAVTNVAQTDLIHIFAVDIAAADGRLAIQAEAGSRIFIGNDRLRFAATTGTIGIGATDVANFLSTGQVKIAGTATRATTEGTNHLDIFDGTAPVGTLANGISLYSTTGELRVMDSAGNATLLSPHDNLTNEWIFDSVNTTTGKTLKIDMERLVKAVNAEFGWNFVQEYSGSKPLIDAAGRQVYERRQKRGGDGKLLYEPMTETVTIEVEAATTSTPAKTRQEQRIMTRKQSVVVTKEVEIPVGQSGRFVKGKHDTIEERDVPIDDLTKPVMEDVAVMEAIYVPLPQTTVSTTIVDLRAQLAVLQARLAALEAKVP